MSKKLFLCISLILFQYLEGYDEIPDYIDDFDIILDSSPLKDGYWTDTCVSNIQESKQFTSCESSNCIRYVEDSFLDEASVEILLNMMKKGMNTSHSIVTGGPTILDINSGYLMDNEGLINIYQNHRGQERVYFTNEEYKIYRNLFETIKNKIETVFEITDLYFTAPTFVARITGNDTWKPLEEHDKYYMPHIDKDNTDHYFYSGLVYLTEYDTDFTGGEFLFLDKDSTNNLKAKAVLPRKGRFITFTSGKENFHKVNKVLSGTRFTLSMWFTCDPSKKFQTFLDGKVHDSFEKQQKKEL